MPLDRYGVLVGTLHRSFRDTPDDQGRWFHVNLQVQAPGGPYRCAVDSHPWTSGSHIQAAEALEPILVPGRRVLIFGEPFASGLGMHNIHQNQGDPAASQWWDQNGIWQDGGTFTERPDGRFDAFLSKFSTQASTTDGGGHPVR